MRLPLFFPRVRGHVFQLELRDAVLHHRLEERRGAAVVRLLGAVLEGPLPRDRAVQREDGHAVDERGKRASQMQMLKRGIVRYID